MLKQLIAAALGCMMLAYQPVQAHGDMKPRHGGVVQTANDVNFELVTDADGATIYLVDHDEDMPSKGITGKLTVLQGDKKADVEVKAADGNKLRANGVKIGPGAKIVAVLKNVEGRTVTVRFTIK